MKVIKKEGKAGHYRSKVLKFSKEGIEIDNYSERKIYYKRQFYSRRQLIETIKEKRVLPEKVMPPRIVRMPVPKAKLLLIDHKNPFWKLDPKVKRDITCWVVHTSDGKTLLYDAVTGKKVGEGIPAPTDKAISLSGFHEDSWPDPWSQYRENALYWYNKWGFSTWNVFAPPFNQHSIYIQDNLCKFRYALAHGGSFSFCTCKELWVTASNIASWMVNRDKMTFAFLGHCGGMCNTGSGTLSYAFRKGSLSSTVTIGYCGMESDLVCWANSLNWQKKLFEKADTGVTWKDAFDYALACYPECSATIRFVGDETLTLSGGVVEKPDLTVTDIWTVGDKVHYRVKNIGIENAGASYTSLTIDDIYKAITAESSLAAGVEREGIFDSYSWQCEGASDKIKVYADNYGALNEANENNNYMEKTITCGGGGDFTLSVQSEPSAQKVFVDGVHKGNTPVTVTATCEAHTIKVGEGVVEKPDLTITEIWTVGDKIHYKIKNIGSVAAGASHTSLTIDGIYQTTIAEATLDVGAEREGIFSAYSWQCSGMSDAIKVYADCDSEVDEANENNNAMTKTINCGGDLPDLIITQTWSWWGPIHFKEKNIGTVTANAHHTSVTNVGKIAIPALAPGEEQEFSIQGSSFLESWTVCADCDSEVVESNEGNNCLSGSL